MKTKTVDVSACRAAVGEVYLAAAGKEAASRKVILRANSGQVFEHWWFGRMVFDFAGMQHKERTAINYVHNENQILGYVNKWNVTESGALEMSGALVPQHTHKRTEEVLTNIGEGIPYEASLEWPPSKPGDLLVEELSDDQVATVNGQQVAGPLVILRSWVCRGVAICPLGADSDTETRMAAGSKGNVEYEVKEQGEGSMKDNETTTVEAPSVEPKPEETPASVETPAAEEVTEEKKDEATEPAEQPAAEEPAAATESASIDRVEFKAWVDLFGAEKATAYMLAGKGKVEAMAEYAKELKAENESLKAGRGYSGADFTPTAQASTPVSKEVAEVAKRCGVDPEKVQARLNERKPAR